MKRYMVTYKYTVVGIAFASSKNKKELLNKHTAFEKLIDEDEDYGNREYTSDHGIVKVEEIDKHLTK